MSLDIPHELVDYIAEELSFADYCTMCEATGILLDPLRVRQNFMKNKDTYVITLEKHCGRKFLIKWERKNSFGELCYQNLLYSYDHENSDYITMYSEKYNKTILDKKKYTVTETRETQDTGDFRFDKRDFVVERFTEKAYKEIESVIKRLKNISIGEIIIIEA